MRLHEQQRRTPCGRSQLVADELVARGAACRARRRHIGHEHGQQQQLGRADCIRCAVRLGSCQLLLLLLRSIEGLESELSSYIVSAC